MNENQFPELDEIMSNPLLKVSRKDHHVGYYEFQIGELSTPLWLKLGRELTSETTHWDQSHAMHTPTQAGPYWTSNPSSGSPVIALSRAISGLLDYYEQAVSKGHKPSESWLVEG